MAHLTYFSKCLFVKNFQAELEAKNKNQKTSKFNPAHSTSVLSTVFFTAFSGSMWSESATLVLE